MDTHGTERDAPAGERRDDTLVPYSVWADEIAALLRSGLASLAEPKDIFDRVPRSVLVFTGRASTIGQFLAYQEAFYREAYRDPEFTFDLARLALPRSRVEQIKAALIHGEVDYPLVTALPRTLTEEEQQQTLHRVLMDRLIRARGIAVWQRTDPTVDEFLEQIRDCTLRDLTRTDLLGPDGQPLRFANDDELENEDENQPWLQYFKALYPTLLRQAAVSGYQDVSFVKRERDPPMDRRIHGTGITIQGRSQIEAAAHGFPLIAVSRHLALFAQYHAATGECLDTKTWSWTSGVLDPRIVSGRPSVGMDWDLLFLNMGGLYPADANAGGRLRAAY